MRLATGSLAWTTLLTICIAAMPVQESKTNEDNTGQPMVIPAWPKDAPGSEKWTQKEVEHVSEADRETIVRNVVRPTLTAFLPHRTKANGTAVIVCPGGGFHCLSWNSEGTEVAEWLRSRGIAAFVLKYRLKDTGATEKEFRKAVQASIQAAVRESMLASLKGMADFKKRGTPEKPPAIPEVIREIAALAAADGKQAVKVVREHASEWGVKPDRIGMIGFSAGGRLTVGVLTNYDGDSRPIFAALIYGPGFSSVKVPSDAPPIFLVCASDDPLVSAADSVRLYSEWNAARKSAELHIYAKGSHGFGMRKQGLPCDGWIDRFGDWLAQQGLLRPASRTFVSRPTRAVWSSRAACIRAQNHPADPSDSRT
jgi:acetyl esterase/lipase